MGKKILIIVYLFCFILSSIPDSLGCNKCLGEASKAGIIFNDQSFDQEASNPAKGKVEVKQPASLDQNGNSPCHFCLIETAANPGGFCLPDLMVFSGSREIIVSKTGDLIFSINRPPEILL